MSSSLTPKWKRILIFLMPFLFERCPEGNYHWRREQFCWCQMNENGHGLIDLHASRIPTKLARKARMGKAGKHSLGVEWGYKYPLTEYFMIEPGLYQRAKHRQAEDLFTLSILGSGIDMDSVLKVTNKYLEIIGNPDYHLGNLKQLRDGRNYRAACEVSKRFGYDVIIGKDPTRPNGVRYAVDGKSDVGIPFSIHKDSIPKHLQAVDHEKEALRKRISAAGGIPEEVMRESKPSSIPLSERIENFQRAGGDPMSEATSALESRACEKSTTLAKRIIDEHADKVFHGELTPKPSDVEAKPNDKETPAGNGDGKQESGGDEPTGQEQ